MKNMKKFFIHKCICLALILNCVGMSTSYAADPADEINGLNDQNELTALYLKNANRAVEEQERKVKTLLQEIGQWAQKTKTLNNENESLQKKSEELVHNHQKEVQDLKEDHKKTLEKLSDDHRQKVEKLAALHAEQIAKMEEVHKKQEIKLGDVEEAYKKDLQEAKTLYEKKLEEVRYQYTEDQEKQNKKFSDEIKTKEVVNKKQESALKEAKKTYEDALKEIRKAYENEKKIQNEQFDSVLKQKKEENETHQIRLQEIQESHQNEVDRIKEELRKAQKEYEKEIEKIHKAHQKEKEKENHKFSDEIKQKEAVNKKQESALKEAKKAYEEKLEEIQKVHNEEIEKMNTHHKEEKERENHKFSNELKQKEEVNQKQQIKLSEVEEAHKRDLKEAQIAHEKELAEVHKKYENQKKIQKEEFDAVLKEKEEKKTEIVEILEKKKEENENLVDLINDEQKKIKELQKGQEEHIANLDRARKENDKLKQEIESLQRTSSTGKAAKQEADQERKKLLTQQKALVARVTELTNSHQKKAEEQTQEMRQTAEELKKLVGENDSLKDKVQQLEATLKEIEGQNEGERKHFKEAEEKYRKIEERHNKTEKKKKKAEKHINKMKKELKKGEREKDQWKKKEAEFQKSREALLEYAHEIKDQYLKIIEDQKKKTLTLFHGGEGLWTSEPYKNLFQKCQRSIGDRIKTEGSLGKKDFESWLKQYTKDDVQDFLINNLTMWSGGAILGKFSLSKTFIEQRFKEIDENLPLLLYMEKVMSVFSELQWCEFQIYRIGLTRHRMHTGDFPENWERTRSNQLWRIESAKEIPYYKHPDLKRRIDNIEKYFNFIDKERAFLEDLQKDTPERTIPQVIAAMNSQDKQTIQNYVKEQCEGDAHEDLFSGLKKCDAKAFEHFLNGKKKWFSRWFSKGSAPKKDKEKEYSGDKLTDRVSREIKQVKDLFVGSMSLKEIESSLKSYRKDMEEDESQGEKEKRPLVISPQERNKMWRSLRIMEKLYEHLKNLKWYNRWASALNFDHQELSVRVRSMGNLIKFLKIKKEYLGKIGSFTNDSFEFDGRKLQKWCDERISKKLFAEFTVIDFDGYKGETIVGTWTVDDFNKFLNYFTKDVLLPELVDRMRDWSGFSVEKFAFSKAEVRHELGEAGGKTPVEYCENVVNTFKALYWYKGVAQEIGIFWHNLYQELPGSAKWDAVEENTLRILTRALQYAENNPFPQHYDRFIDRIENMKKYVKFMNKLRVFLKDTRNFIEEKEGAKIPISAVVPKINGDIKEKIEDYIEEKCTGSRTSDLFGQMESCDVQKFQRFLKTTEESLKKAYEEAIITKKKEQEEAVRSKETSTAKGGWWGARLKNALWK